MASPPNLLLPGSRPLLLPSSRVTFRDYFARREGEDYVVGLPETSTYLAIPPIGVEVLELLAHGLTVQEAALRLRDGDGETPDVRDFVETMIAYGLVATVDGRSLSPSQPSAEAAPEGRLIARIPSRYAGWFFSRPAFVVHSAVFLVVLALVVRHGYTPESSDFFVYHRYALDLLLVAATVVVFGLLHELGHLLAARGRGLAGRLQVRLRQVGINAEFPDAWRLARGDRIVVYLGGLVVTLWVFAAALGLVLWAGSSLPAMLERWLRLVLVVQLWFFAWQLHFFKKTDGYFIAADLLQAKGLMEDTRAFLHPLGRRLLGRPPSQTPPDLPDGRRKAAEVYSVLYLLGVAVAVAFFGGLILPFVISSAEAAARAVGSSGTGIIRRLDAAAALALYASMVVIVVRVARRKQLAHNERRSS